MSQVYSTEPQTTGRVILNTSHGSIDIRLFCKEAPTTCRSFLQLCLDGYYDDLVFHRIINDFLIQTGKRECPEALRKNSQYDGIEKSYRKKLPPLDLHRKKLEIIPRIKFNHRGQVAMAVPLEDSQDPEESTTEELESLSKQFFITMDEAPFLDKKYVIFGTIRGDTIFNALRIGKTETIGDSGELAVQDNAPRIINVRVMEHTFEDLVATKDDFVPWKQEQYKQNGDTQEDILKKRRKKRKGKRDLNVLSFGGEMEDMEQGLLESTKGIQSSHDIFANKSMNSKVEEPGMEMDSGKAKRLKVRKDIEKEKETDFKEQHDMEVKDMENKHDTEIQPPPLQVNATDAADTASPVENASLSSKIQQSRSLPSETEEKSHEENETRAKEPPKVSAIEARRLKYLHKRSEKELGRKPSKQREDDTMLKLNEFQRKILQVKGVKDKAYENKGAKVDNSLASRMARKLETLQDNRSDIEEKPIYNGQVLEVEKEDENIEYATGTDWLKSKFKCKRHIDQNAKDRALGGDGRNMEEYEVVDDKILRRNSKGYARDQKQSKRHHV